MKLKRFIEFRKKLKNIEKPSYGIKGLFEILNNAELSLIKEFEDNDIREIYDTQNNTVKIDKLEIGNKFTIAIELYKFPNYYETFQKFINNNRYELKNSSEFFILEFNYLHNTSSPREEIENYFILQKIIAFLIKLSTYEKSVKGSKELLFHKQDKICPILLEYNVGSINRIDIEKNALERLDKDIFNGTNNEEKKKIFSNEMINILKEEISFDNLLSNWNTIESNYRNSFQNYLSEFSFDKIKTSSHEYLYELTDRIYSTINKFSAYILGTPIAYIFILRFFDFKGNSILKDFFLLLIGILYFVIIKCVLLSNLKEAFTSIQTDINRFLEKINSNNNLNKITETLKNQINETIPNQKKKIKIVNIISWVILSIMIISFGLIYYKQIFKFLICFFKN